MALWFFTLFVWYGVVTELQQVSCFRNTGSGGSNSKKIFRFPFKDTTDSSYIQRKEGFVGVKHHENKPQESRDGNNNKQVAVAIQIRRNDNQLVIQKRRIKRTLQNKHRKKHNNSQQVNVKSNPHPVVPPVEIFYNGNVSIRNRKSRASAAEKIKNSGFKHHFQLQNTRFKETRNRPDFINLNAQVPDDDTYDDGREQTGETDDLPPDDDERIPKFARYFYRNNRRMLVSNDQEENDKYYKEQNKGIEDDGGLHVDQTHSELEKAHELLETSLYKDDALEEAKDVGPTFKNSMTWVNMMRANRGWFPKGTYA